MTPVPFCEEQNPRDGVYGVNGHNELAEVFARGRQDPVFRKQRGGWCGSSGAPTTKVIRWQKLVLQRGCHFKSEVDIAKLVNYKESGVSSPRC